MLFLWPANAGGPTDFSKKHGDYSGFARGDNSDSTVREGANRSLMAGLIFPLVRPAYCLNYLTPKQYRKTHASGGWSVQNQKVTSWSRNGVNGDVPAGGDRFLKMDLGDRRFLPNYI